MICLITIRTKNIKELRSMKFKDMIESNNIKKYLANFIYHCILYLTIKNI